MPFVKSSQSAKYFAPAFFNALTEGGALVAHKFDVQCKRLTRTQMKALDADIAQLVAQGVTDKDRLVFERVICGWRAVQDAEGIELPFSIESADEVEEAFPGFIGSCVRAFYLSTMPAEAAHLAAKN
jgi:hypothetical protein